MARIVPKEEMQMLSETDIAVWKWSLRLKIALCSQRLHSLKQKYSKTVILSNILTAV